MKKYLLIGLIVLTLVLSTVVIGGKHLPKGNAVAENVDMNHTISVSGEGVVQTTPDISVINFGITIQRKTAVDAMNELSGVANKTISVLKNAGVNDKDIKTVNIGLAPVYQWDKDKKLSILVGYKATESFELKVKISDAGRMIGLISNNGVNNISGIRFDISDKKALEQDAITDAMDNARKKAEAALKGSNYKIVGIKTISVNSNNPTPIFRNSIGAVDKEAEIPVEGGSMSVRASVQVVFIFD